MSEADDNQQKPERQHHRVDPSPITFELSASVASLQVIPADNIEVEGAENLKYLRLKNGDFQVPKAVFLTIEGRRMEITMDALPEDSQS